MDMKLRIPGQWGLQSGGRKDCGKGEERCLRFVSFQSKRRWRDADGDYRGHQLFPNMLLLTFYDLNKMSILTTCAYTFSFVHLPLPYLRFFCSYGFQHFYALLLLPNKHLLFPTLSGVKNRPFGNTAGLSVPETWTNLAGHTS